MIDLSIDGTEKLSKQLEIGSFVILMFIILY